MTTALLSQSVQIGGPTWTDIYTCPAATSAVVISAIAASPSVACTMAIARKSGSTVYPLTGNVAIAVDTAVNLLAGKLILAAGEKLQAAGGVTSLLYATAQVAAIAPLGTVVALFGNGTETLLAASDTGIWRSADGGVTWAQRYTGTATTFTKGGYIDTTWFIYTSATASWKSTDDGLTWTAQAVTNAPTVLCNSIGGIAKNGSTYAGLFDSTHMTTTTDGITWTQAAAFAQAVGNLCWTGTNYVAGRSATASDMYYSTDGASWTTVTGTGLVTGTYPKGLVSNGSGVVIAMGQASGVSRSADHGATWADITTGVPGLYFNTASMFGVWTGSAFAFHGASGTTVAVSTTGAINTWTTTPSATTLTRGIVAKLTSNWAFCVTSSITASLNNVFTGRGNVTVTASVMEVS